MKSCFQLKKIPYFDKVVRVFVNNIKELLIDTRMISIGVLNKWLYHSSTDKNNYRTGIFY